MNDPDDTSATPRSRVRSLAFEGGELFVEDYDDRPGFVHIVLKRKDRGYLSSLPIHRSVLCRFATELAQAYSNLPVFRPGDQIRYRSSIEAPKQGVSNEAILRVAWCDLALGGTVYTFDWPPVVDSAWKFDLVHAATESEYRQAVRDLADSASNDAAVRLCQERVRYWDEDLPDVMGLVWLFPEAEEFPADR